MIYIGIDPGVSGALAVIDGETGQITIQPYEEEMYRQILHDVCMEDCLCCIEQVHSMPKQGVATTFKFGMNFGIIKGMLKAFYIPYQEIPPQRWKKEFGLNSDKAKSIEVCHHLFPNVSLRKTARCTTDDDNMAEALLMALYAKRKL